jgi:hypothetical protein
MQLRILHVVCSIFLTALCFAGAHSVSAATFTVTTTADTADVIPGDGICADTVGQCTFRGALEESNALVGLDVVNFDILPAGPHTLFPAYGYPGLMEGITIDGTTQPGYAGVPIIEIDGAVQSSAVSAPIALQAPHNIIKGLVVNNFQTSYSGPGILIDGGNYSVIKNCYIGTDLTGTIAKPNNEGIFIDMAHHVTIGGPNVSDRNILSGNTFQGIDINNGDYITIEGNYIGLNSAGNVAVPNNQMLLTGGVSIFGGHNIVKKNTISGNNGYGLNILGGYNIVENNYIGTNPTGTSAIPNTSHGVSMTTASVWYLPHLNEYNTIGGNVISKRNIIAGNGGNGIHMDRWESYPINAYGQDISNNTIQNNYIGVGFNGTQSIPNQGHGIYINAADKNIFTKNTIANNIYNGIAVNFGTAVFATRDQFTKNSIYNNGQLGIDLSINNSTANDTLDTDVGPNMLQNNPFLKSATHVGNTTKVTGTFNAMTNRPFLIELYSSPNNVPGQGKNYVGTFTVNTNAQGMVNPAIFTIPSYITSGQYITAIAIDAVKGDTSEFSNAVVVS